MTERPAFLGRAARWMRFALLTAIAVLLGLIVTTPRNQVPLSMSRAQANAVAAAPGFLLTTLTATNGSQFFLVDTVKQVICVYNVTGDKLRLEGARKFDTDSDILDGSFPSHPAIEGGNGLARDEATAYWQETKPKIDKLAEKTPKK